MKKINFKTGVLIAVVILGLISVISSALEYYSNNKKEEEKEKTEILETNDIEEEEKVEILDFKIVSKSDVSDAVNNNMVFRVSLNTTIEPDKILLQNTAVSIWEDGNRVYDDFTIFFYLSGMNTESMAYCTIVFDPLGITNWSINPNSLLVNKPK